MPVTNIVTAIKDGKIHRYVGVKEVVYPTRPSLEIAIPHVIPSHLPWEDDLKCTLVFISDREVEVDRILDTSQYSWDEEDDY